MKMKKAEEIGAICEVNILDERVSEDELKIIISNYNKDESIHGILVQLPLPNHLPRQNITDIISPTKDVDGLTSTSQAKLLHNDDSSYLPATPRGIMTILDRYKIELAGKKVVVVGRSNLVGLPVSLLCLNRDATVTVCHSKTMNLPMETSGADILIIAAGKPNMIKSEFIKPGVVIVDVGITRTSDGLKGDVDLDDVMQKVKYITPVPGGVGPMTVVSLWQNVIDACL